ncbi:MULTISPECIES: hypothetical protein [Paenibacillus]|uniref:hypothetical protein n=1 Tax=Paenibacillus TaxID=44249 RepID=UPI0015C3A38B|nr:hypothetical protein [Paenibacillus odorifer]MEC0131552.1 hypothetical protein [Paenibacillus odorifer]MEC0220295.1 hypothetical protein [Paenibacillus odorifer]
MVNQNLTDVLAFASVIAVLTTVLAQNGIVDVDNEHSYRVDEISDWKPSAM